MDSQTYNRQTYLARKIIQNIYRKHYTNVNKVTMLEVTKYVTPFVEKYLVEKIPEKEGCEFVRDITDIYKKHYEETNEAIMHELTYEVTRLREKSGCNESEYEQREKEEKKRKLFHRPTHVAKKIQDIYEQNYLVAEEDATVEVERDG